ncbi:MAG TPA: glycosyltransferase family 10 [Steroidobacteraceae bacterium]|nr:glycosyltransferase family 10 [Steroidobacteraceae bacterium]
MRREISIDFADFWHPNTIEAKKNNFLYTLLSKRFDLKFEAKPEFLLYSCFGVSFIRHSGTRIYYTGENTRPNFGHCDWAFSFDYNEHHRHMRLPYYFFVNPNILIGPKDIGAALEAKTKFCAFVYSNVKARTRIKFLEKLSRYKQVDCGGGVRNNLGYRVGDKIAFLQAYKFNIAFENESYPGYTTEKIAQTFMGNCVPIYWGNPLIDRDFNREAFVNCHDFRNLDQVVDFVVELDRNDALYRRCLEAPAFVDDRLTPFVDEDLILDRFEEIFTTPIARPAAQTVRGRIANWVREPKQIRRERRARQTLD